MITGLSVLEVTWINVPGFDASSDVSKFILNLRLLALKTPAPNANAQSATLILAFIDGIYFLLCYLLKVVQAFS
ncbi:hypothetical protein [Helicobacter felis]|uniref:hypothetical protein n=1 Tax=Helicobacter felis TaxID=214 RepID=UPI0013154FAF|nr:hypothetical protein [Helicobacter felis]